MRIAPVGAAFGLGSRRAESLGIANVARGPPRYTPSTPSTFLLDADMEHPSVVGTLVSPQGPEPWSLRSRGLPHALLGLPHALLGLPHALSDSRPPLESLL